VTAGKHHPEHAVLNCIDIENFADNRGQRQFAFHEPLQFGHNGARNALAAQDGDGTITRGCHQPG
jgi:hypothetical protein